MGKKSKKSKGKTPAASAPSAETRDVVTTSSNQNNRIVASHQPTPVAAASHYYPKDVTCWICLDGDFDEEGKPPVRDCSCRGSDAGFAHLSCLIHYATAKSKELLECGGEWLTPWKECPNCKQDYQRRLAFDMGKSCLSFLDEKQAPKEARRYPLLGIMLSLDVNATDDSEEARASQEECRQAAYELLSITHPESLDAVPAYICLSTLAGLKDQKELAQEYLKKAVDIQKSHGDEEEATTVQSLSSLWLPKADGGLIREDVLRARRAAYEKVVTDNGQNSPVAIQSGITLVIQLLRAERRRVIECTRLSTQLFTASQLVHGPEHQKTTFLAELIEGCLQRRVLVYEKDGISQEFEALQYDAGKYLVKGPISDPRKPETERVCQVEGTDIVYPPGTPVICQGLKQAAHLNGKLGEVGRYVNDRDRYEVHFEDKSLGCASVKVSNFCIAFELPDQD